MGIEPSLLSRRQQIVIEDPLYTTYDVSSSIDDDSVAMFAFSRGHLDAYCPNCKTKSVYMVDHGMSYSDKVKNLPLTGVFSVEARCTRHGVDLFKQTGKLYSTFYRNFDTMIKIGQFPSRAVLDFGSLDSVFDIELNKSFRAELGTAIGLRAHGIGVGSFVYLRRIFEGLVEDAHQKAMLSEGWNDAKYRSNRMSEKIKMLHNYLPSRLTRTANMYSILSKGIHEMDENECKKYFDLVFDAIKMILVQQHEDKIYEKIISDVDSESAIIKSKK